MGRGERHRKMEYMRQHITTCYANRTVPDYWRSNWVWIFVR